MSELVSYAALVISIFSLMITIYDRRLRKTPPIGFQSEYVKLGDVVRITVRLGRLQMEPYFLEHVRTIGSPRPKILSVSVFRPGESKPVVRYDLWNVRQNLQIGIDSAFDHPDGEKTACVLVCEMESPQGRSAILQLRCLSSYWPQFAWYNIKIPLPDGTTI